MKNISRVILGLIVAYVVFFLTLFIFFALPDFYKPSGSLYLYRINFSKYIVFYILSVSSVLVPLSVIRFLPKPPPYPASFSHLLSIITSFLIFVQQLNLSFFLDSAIHPGFGSNRCPNPKYIDLGPYALPNPWGCNLYPGWTFLVVIFAMVPLVLLAWRFFKDGDKRGKSPFAKIFSVVNVILGLIVIVGFLIFHVWSLIGLSR